MRDVLNCFLWSSLFHKGQPSMYPVAFDGILVVPVPKWDLKLLCSSDAQHLRELLPESSNKSQECLGYFCVCVGLGTAEEKLFQSHSCSLVKLGIRYTRGSGLSSPQI